VYEGIGEEFLSDTDKDVLCLIEKIMKRVESKKYGNWITVDPENCMEKYYDSYTLTLPFNYIPALKDASIGIFASEVCDAISLSFNTRNLLFPVIAIPKNFKTDKTGYYKHAIDIIANTIKLYKELDENYKEALNVGGRNDEPDS